jgi:predicted transglutaminase-like cysteine proteinase
MFAWVGIMMVSGLHLMEPLPLLHSIAPLSLLSANYLGADSSVDGRRTTTTPERKDDTKADKPAALLFDMETEPVADGDVLEKWRGVKADIAREFEVLRRCQAGGPCPPVAQRLLDIITEGAGHSGRARVGLINRAVDLAIAPTSDERQWGMRDRWSAPFETLQSSRGDCEDYAIVKYVALLQAGVPADDVKIVVLRNLLPNEDHAAVAARVDGQWLILDNLRLTLVRDTDVVRAIPRFVLDQQGARRFVWASRKPRRAAVSGT